MVGLHSECVSRSAVVEFGTVKDHSRHKALISTAKGQCGTVDLHCAFYVSSLATDLVNGDWTESTGF